MQGKKIYFEAESVEEFCYNLRELEYSEKDQDSLLVGNGLSFIADWAAMRRLLSGNKMSKARTGETMREREPTSTITIVPSHTVFHGKKCPNYPITITLEDGGVYLESILMERKNWKLNEMRRSVTATNWEIRVEGLFFRADKTEMSEWCDSYKEQLEARRKAREEKTALLAAHATLTNKELSGAPSTPEVAAGGRGDGEVRSMEASTMSVVNWGALTPERVCKEVEECGHESADACSVSTQ